MTRILRGTAGRALLRGLAGQLETICHRQRALPGRKAETVRLRLTVRHRHEQIRARESPKPEMRAKLRLHPVCLLCGSNHERGPAPCLDHNPGEPHNPDPRPVPEKKPTPDPEIVLELVPQVHPGPDTGLSLDLSHSPDLSLSPYLGHSPGLSHSPSPGWPTDPQPILSRILLPGPDTSLETQYP